jgi:hypothetical protein
MNYTLLLRHFEQNGRKYARAEQLWFAGQPSLEAAIDTAARAVNECGKRYRHQTRIRRTAIAQAKPALLKVKEQIQACDTFDHLHDTVISALNGIEGLSELYYYDTAVRIGFYRDITPRKVYLHTGARDGARALGLDYSAPFLEVSAVPKALRRLPPHEIEDFFCIYKDKVIRRICGG